ncbi:hypothetical protein BJ912DRAFT_948987 [Pholiota molesta]|nr:hypothetical protein BJ912DRAFT_948987 [Pholiota molesta]
MPCSEPLDHATNNTLRRSSRHKNDIRRSNVGTVDASASCAIPEPSTSNSPVQSTSLPRIVSFSGQESGINILNLTISTEKRNEMGWCSGCKDGGNLVFCSECNFCALCDDCVTLGKGDEGEDIDFICPKCFLWKTPKIPYPHTLLNKTSTREFWPKIITVPLAIISIRLQGIKASETPVPSLYHYLVPWMDGNLVSFDIDFDFSKKSGCKDFEKRLGDLIRFFTEGEFRDCARFMVFLSTHSDPTNGHLHIAPGNGAEVPVKKLLDTLFSADFRTVLQRSPYNILNLMTCGALTVFAESQLKAFAKEKVFGNVLAFTQPNLLPSLTFRFFNELGLNHFIYDRKTLKHLLRDNQILGAHTDVVQYKADSYTTFKWTHPILRPMGEHIVPQCPTCHRIRIFNILKTTPEFITLKCSFSSCDYRCSYYFPAKTKWVFGPSTKDDERGAWCYITVRYEEEDKKEEHINDQDVNMDTA